MANQLAIGAQDTDRAAYAGTVVRAVAIRVLGIRQVLLVVAVP
jgi:hypothetical protein